MKKLLLSLAAMALGMSAMAQNDALYTLAFSADLNDAKVSSYSSSFGVKASADATSSTWTVTNFNNNNNGNGQSNTQGAWDFVRCGSKSAASTASIINTQAWTESIAQVVINMNKTKNLGAKEVITSAKLEVLSSADAEKADATYDITEAVNTLTQDAKDVTVTITAPAANKFYKIVFDCPKYSKNGTWQVNTVKYYGQAAPEKDVKTPTFSLVKTAEGYAVEMSCATEGAQIYYTVDYEAAPADPTNASEAYSAPIDVWGKAYFKAIAYKGEDASNVASFTANPPMVLDSFSGMSDLAKGTEVEYRGEATVIYQSTDKNYVYVVGNHTPMLLYGNTNVGPFSNGNIIKGISGTYSPFNGLPEIVSYTIDETVSTDGEAVQPMEAEFSDIQLYNLNRYVKLEYVTITKDESDTRNKTYTIKNTENEELVMCNQLGIEVNFEAGKPYIVYGFVGCYEKGDNTTMQVYPTEIVGTNNVSAIESEDAAPVYYNLQGVRVNNPERGIYIQVKGNKATKVVL